MILNKINTECRLWCTHESCRWRKISKDLQNIQMLIEQTYTLHSCYMWLISCVILIKLKLLGCLNCMVIIFINHIYFLHWTWLIKFCWIVSGSNKKPIEIGCDFCNTSSLNVDVNCHFNAWSYLSMKIHDMTSKYFKK